MIRKAFFLLLVWISTIVNAAAAESIDKKFTKPALNTWSTWGTIASTSVNYDGYGKSFALVIGISDYNQDSGFADLPTSNDAIRIKDYLFDEAGYDYVHLLTESAVTQDRVRELIHDEFPKLVGDKDRFLFYWSGHGETRTISGGGKEGYLAVSTSTDGSFASMVSMDEIRTLNQLIDARQSFYLLDSCFSGLAGSVRQSKSRQETINILRDQSSHLLAAGKDTEQTIAADAIGGSVFTAALLEGMRGAADASTSTLSSDGVVSVYELSGYVQRRIPNLLREKKIRWNKSITPQVRDLRSGDGQYFFISKQKKIDELENAGYDVSGELLHGVPKSAIDDIITVPPEPDHTQSRFSKKQVIYGVGATVILGVLINNIPRSKPESQPSVLVPIP